MSTISHDVWRRRGFSLLWDEKSLAAMLRPEQVLPLRALFTLARRWPDDLPANGGQALIVAGLDVALDALGDADTATCWLESSVRPVLRRFEEQYQPNGAVIFWVPAGARRLELHTSSGEHRWRLQRGGEVALLQGLWGGSALGAATILDPDRGETAIGMYLQRLSG